MFNLSIQPVWSTVLTALMVTVLLSPAIVIAEEASEPQALVKDASDRMVQALKDNKDKIEQDPSFVYGLVDAILIPNFDFAKMSKLALGKNWRKANAQQRERFIGEFRLLLVRTYSTAMLEYSDEEIVFLPFRDDLAKKRVKVRMEVLQTGGPSIPMGLSMYLNKDNAWKVYDVKIDGISLVTNYRSSFAAEIRQGGMEKLIDDLASRNEKVKA
ncbi:MAG: phospholipid transport system substrate-binding protein [Methylophagaceae bacterium]|jgi:phospholipid transport system substrate-binding protein